MNCGTSELGRKLTAEWNSPGVRYANHFVKWHDTTKDYFITGYRSLTALTYSKGRKAFVNRKPVIRRKRR